MVHKKLVGYTKQRKQVFIAVSCVCPFLHEFYPPLSFMPVKIKGHGYLASQLIYYISLEQILTPSVLEPI